MSEAMTDLGKASKHNESSGGPPHYNLCHYGTTYSREYCKEVEKFRNPVYNKNSGYTNNHRSVITYTKNLDEHDFPEFIPELEDAKITVFKKNYTWKTQGDQDRSTTGEGRVSGFQRSTPYTAVRNSQVVDLKATLERDRLKANQKADEPNEEKDGLYMAPCAKTSYTEHRFKPVPHSAMGVVAHPTAILSGFVNSKSHDPVTFLNEPVRGPHGRYQPDLPGRSMSSTQYVRHEPEFTGRGYNDKARLDGVPQNSGFTKSVLQSSLNKPAVPASMTVGDSNADRTISKPPPQLKSSVGAHVMKARDEAQRTGRVTVGGPEMTGHSRNNTNLEPNIADFYRNTTYKTDYRSAYLRDARNIASGLVLPPQEDGFTRSTKHHDHGADLPDVGRFCHTLDKYEGKSYLARDPTLAESAIQPGPRQISVGAVPRRAGWPGMKVQFEGPRYEEPRFIK